MDGGGVSQLHGVLSSYTKAHFVARVPAARSNWEKLVAVQRRPARPWSCGALAFLSFTDCSSRIPCYLFLNDKSHL